MSIYIFSRPIRSGKTTALLQWGTRQQNIAGVAMPDINGSRKILDLSNNTFFDIECPDAATSKERITTIGRFHFYSSAFEKANSILLKALAQHPRWLIIDEVGKLELAGKGFHDPVVKAIEFYGNPVAPGNLLITVRVGLVEDVISLFNLRDCKVIDKLEELC